MVSKIKFIDRLLRGTSDSSLSFEGLRTLLHDLGFQERVRVSHHIFSKEGIAEILNLQPKQGKAKPYQVRQVRKLLVRYRLLGDRHEP